MEKARQDETVWYVLKTIEYVKKTTDDELLLNKLHELFNNRCREIEFGKLEGKVK